MKKKKYLFFIVVAISLLILVKNIRASYNGTVNMITYENIKEHFKDDYESNDGTMYESLSDYFDYRIYPIEIVPGDPKVVK